MSGAQAISDSADTAGNPSVGTVETAVRPQRKQGAAANAGRQHSDEKKRDAKPSPDEANGGERPRRARPTQ